VKKPKSLWEPEFPVPLTELQMPVKQSFESCCDRFIINGKKEELQQCDLFHPHVEVKNWSDETHPKGAIFFH